MKKVIEENKEKIIGLFGDQIQNSLSPKIHNFLSNVMGLKYHYFLFDLNEKDLKTAVEGIKVLNIKGVNVTIPYKEKIIKYLDQVDEKVKKIGAVNTVVNEDGQLKGYNTDVDGFDELAFNKGINFQDKKVIIFGAGGVARAVLYFLKDRSTKKITVVNRDLKKANKLKDDFNTIDDLAIHKFGKLDSTTIKDSDIIINATPLGTKDKYEDISPVKKENILETHTLIDLVYNPRVTKFLKNGNDKEAKTVSGIEMLVYQGVKAFEIWTDTTVDYHVVNELINNL
ncbi:MAG: shikimate dehydrogenase [Halanaerobiales bacterium]|nr:shikimate dehydrogenase [Halanaerobiales bacterium]